LNLGHCWTGEWQAQWIVDIQGQSMTGSIRVNNHFFENGNVQFNLHKKYDTIALAGSDGESICQKINEVETAY